MIRLIWHHATRSTVGFLVVFGSIVFVAGALLLLVPSQDVRVVAFILLGFGGFMFSAGFIAWLLYIIGVLPRR